MTRPRFSSADVTAQHVDRVFETRAAASGFALDAAQRRVAERLSVLGERLRERGQGYQPQQGPELMGASPPPRGVYLWGPVGRGKTWLLDAFVATLPAGTPRRVHLHALFRRLHVGIQRHGFGADALAAAVREIVADATVLHIEEFHVHDPGNAALLSRLLEALAELRITLVTSSNYAPHDLFDDPEFGHVFRPATTMITRNMDVLALDGGADYRLGSAGGAFRRGRWIVADQAANGDAAARRPPTGEHVELRVDGRGIRALRARDAEVWFSFPELLEASTAASDYLTLCERFDTWVLLDVPDLAEASRGARQRLVTLVDVLCDLDVRLTVVAATGRSAVSALPDPPPDLARTVSRLALLGD